MSFNFIIFPDCMEPASGPGAGSRLPAPLRGAEGLVSPRASGLSPCPAPEGTAGARGSQARLCGMSPGTRRESGSVPRPEVTGIVWPGCPRSSSGSSGPALAGNGAKPGGPHPPGDLELGQCTPFPREFPRVQPEEGASPHPHSPPLVWAVPWPVVGNFKTHYIGKKPPRKQHLLPKIPSLPAGTTGWKEEQTLPCWHQSKDWSPGQSLESFMTHRCALLSLSKSSRMPEN